MSEELVDIYNAQKERLGIIVPRNKADLQDGQYILYALSIVQDSSGRYLITQRANKAHWGYGWWETPGGACAAGEDSIDTARREVFEETGLDVSALEPELLYSYRMDNPENNDNYLVDIYRFQTAVDESQINLDPHETSAWQLASWEDICTLHEQGIFLHFERMEKALGRKL